MSTEHAEYWDATEKVISLARVYLLHPDSIYTAQVDAILDFRPELLTCVVNNLGAATFVEIAEPLGFNLTDERVHMALMRPLNVYDIVPAAQASTPDTERGMYWAIKRYLGGEPPQMDNAVLPLYIEHTECPQAHVLNGALPVITHLISKLYAIHDMHPAIFPEQRKDRVDEVIGLIRSRLQSWIGG